MTPAKKSPEVLVAEAVLSAARALYLNRQTILNDHNETNVDNAVSKVAQLELDLEHATKQMVWLERNPPKPPPARRNVAGTRRR